MPNEIYHRSNFGNPNAEGFGDVYYDHAATNKLYNHSDYYENSDGTDATLKDLNNKASIVLTPTAYSDGSLNTVIPPYQVFEERVVNGDFSDGTNGWVGNANTTLSVSNGQLDIQSINASGKYGVAFSEVNFVEGKKYIVKLDVISTDRPTHIRVGTSSTVATGTPQNIFASGDIGIGSHEIIYTATATHTYLSIGGRNDMTTLVIDNVSVREVTVADFDFSRGSSATRVNEQGLVEDVQILSGELVQNGDFEQIGVEKVTNGTFETDSDWTKQTGWSISDGKAIATSTNGSFYQAVDFINGRSYKITFEITSYESGGLICRFNNDETNIFNSIGTYTLYFESDDSFNYVYFLGNSFTGSIDNVSSKEVGQNWAFYNSSSNTNSRFEDNAAVLDASANQFTRFISSSSPMTIGNLYRVTYEVIETDNTTISIQYPLTYIDSSVGVHTVDIIATNTNIGFSKNTVGVVKIDNVSIKEVTDDTDLPRIDFTDGTGSLLLEPQRTNFVTYSEDFSQWSTAGTITVESGYLAPDGSTNAYKITDAAPSNNATALFLGVGAAADNARTIWAKTVSGTGTANLCSYNSNTNNLFTVTNEWQRFEVNSAAATGVTNFYGVDFRNSGTLTEILIWGAQTEVGDYATSYIPTSGSTVTRSADVANNSGNADLFNDSEGVLYAQFTALADDNTSRTVSINNTSSNRVFLSLRATTGQVNSGVVVGGVLQGSAMSDTVSQTSDIKLAIKYKQNDFSLFVNGTQASTSSGNVFSSGTLNDLSFDSGSGAEDFYGKVKCIAVFKEALSNDLLERLTGEGYESFRLLAEANNYTII